MKVLLLTIIYSASYIHSYAAKFKNNRSGFCTALESRTLQISYILNKNHSI